MIQKKKKLTTGSSFRRYSASNPIPDELNISRETLEVQTVKQLRSLARIHKINLRGIRLKKNMINVILSYFLYVKSSKTPSDIEVLDRNFSISVNDSGFIDVSL